MRLPLLASTTLQMQTCHAELPKRADLCCRLPILTTVWGCFSSGYHDVFAQEDKVQRENIARKKCYSHTLCCRTRMRDNYLCHARNAFQPYFVRVSP